MTTSTHARVAAAGLVLGPLLFTVADLLRRFVEPSGPASATAVTAAVGRHGGAWLVAGLLSISAAFCFVIGMVGLVATASGRGARITTVGAVLVGVGAMASVGHAVAYYAPYALYAKAHTAAPTLEALDRVSETYPLLLTLIALFMVGMTLGPIVLFVGLRRAHRVPLWSVVAVVVFIASGSAAGVGAGVVGIVAAMGAFIAAARSLAPEKSRAHRISSPISASVARGAEH
jgi:hypothetical protein